MYHSSSVLLGPDDRVSHSRGAAVHGEGWLHTALRWRAPRPGWQSSCILLIGLLHCRVWVLDPSGQVHSHGTEVIQNLISAKVRKPEAWRARQGYLNTANSFLCPMDGTGDGGDIRLLHGEPVPAVRVQQWLSLSSVQHSGRTGYQRHGPLRGAHANPVGERALRAAG